MTAAALRRLWRAPSVQALLLQCCAFLPSLLIIAMLARAGVAVSYLGAALVQGALAAALCRWRGLAGWWCAIAWLFPPALCGALALESPSWPWGLAFLFLLTVYWSTFRTQVPYYPSSLPVWQAVERALPHRLPLRVIDIGSGLGGMALHLARLRPGADVEGIELAPLPWLVSRLRAYAGRAPVRFTCGDYERLDFGRYDAVFAYLSPAAMGALWEKAAREMRPGAMLLSYEFGVAGRPADLDIVFTQGRPGLHIWRF